MSIVIVQNVMIIFIMIKKTKNAKQQKEILKIVNMDMHLKTVKDAEMIFT